MTPLTRASALLAAVVLSACVLSGCGGAEARRTAHMERGQDYFDKGNLEKARVEFSNALQIAPDDAQARFMSARVAEKLGNVRDAAGLYQAAIDADPEHVQARANLGRVFVFAGAPERAMEIIATAIAKHPDDPDLLTVRGAAGFQLRKLDEARADAQRAAELAPENENAIALLASMYRQSGEAGRAADLIRSALEKRPDSVDLRLVLASLYFTQQEPALGQQQLREVVRLKPKELAYRYQLALSYLREKNVDAAERTFREAVEAAPDRTEAKLALADFLAAQRSIEAGEKALGRFIEQDPDNSDLVLGLGALQQRSGKTDAALATYGRVVGSDENPKALESRNRIAAIYVTQRKFEEASKLVAEVLERNPRDNDALVLRGNIAMERNDPATAIADLRAVLRDQPRSVPLLRTLARAHLANGEPALAEENLHSALDVAPTDVSVRLELGQLLAQGGRAAQAVTILEETVKSSPTDSAAREALVRAYLSSQDLEAARTAAEDLKLTAPTLAAGPYLAGLVAHAQKRLDDAEREFDQALKLQPTAMDALASWARLQLERGRQPAAVARVEAVLRENERNAVAHNLLGELRLQARDFSGALPPFSEALRLAPAWWVPHRNVALAKMAAGDVAGARTAYETGVAATQYQALLVSDLAALYERENRVDDAIRQYEELHRRNPRMALAANNLAMLLVTYRHDQGSLDRARDLTEPFANSDVGAFLDTHGWVRFKRGDVQNALPVLERAAQQAPASSVVRFHLAMAQLKAGQRDKAKNNLQKALDGGAQFAGREEARLALSQLGGGNAG
jgi:tetratricopeptide (TPR) repeat protein